VELYQTIHEVTKGFLGDLSFYDSYEINGFYSLEERLDLLGKFENLKRILDLPERDIAKLAGKKVNRKMEESPLKALAFILKTNKGRSDKSKRTTPRFGFKQIP
jgi:hypothetical protein